MNRSSMESRQRRIFGVAIVAVIAVLVGAGVTFLRQNTQIARETPVVAGAVAITGPGSDEARIVAAVKRDAPSVVALDVTVNGRRLVPGDPFAQLFGGRATARLVPYRAQASGSGFVYSTSGLIVTNAHVVQFGPRTQTRITAVFANGDRVPARLYAADPAADLALVKVDGYAKLPPPLPLGRSEDLNAGQWAIAIGEPFALEQSVTVGVVSGFNRTETIRAESGAAPRTFKGLIQTSAPINPGNSGGPLLDEAGRLIGVNQSVASPAAGAEGIGFAIPVDTVRQQVALLERNPGQTNGAPQTYLGIGLVPLNATVANQFGYRGTGVGVETVLSGGPADRAGIEPGDVITAVNRRTVTSPAQIQDAVRSAKPGQTMTMRVWSNGSTKNVSVRVGIAPQQYGEPSVVR
jgi:S1-C subfamily serine protease